MGVTDGQAVSAAVTNPAFLDANADDVAQGRLDLANTVAASGPTVTNLQREVNSLNSFSGRTAGSAFNATPAWANNDVGSPSDDLFDRADAITAEFDPSAGHTHSGAAGEGPPVDFDASAPTTTKGDIIVHDGAVNVRLPVGADTFVLTADSTSATGLKWDTNTPSAPSLSVATKSANYTLLTTDDVILCNALGGSFTLTLPTAVGNTGKVFYIKKKDTSVNTLTISPNGAETIDALTSWILDTSMESISLVSDGANWWII